VAFDYDLPGSNLVDGIDVSGNLLPCASGSLVDIHKFFLEKLLSPSAILLSNVAASLPKYTASQP
jgi:hypothetical protein